MSQEILLHVNGRVHRLDIDPHTHLIYALRNDLGLMSAKFACGLEQCGACKVIIDGQAVPSCRLPVRAASTASSQSALLSRPAGEWIRRPKTTFS